VLEDFDLMRTAFCFDLDGTVTTTEILPCIASDLDLTAEIATLTRATMDGHIDFRDSFRLRCAVLGSVPPERVRKIVDAVPLHRDVVEFIRAHKRDCFLVTGNLDVWIAPIVDKCEAGVFCSKARSIGGKIKLDYILDKATVIESLRQDYQQIVTVGDGANDVPMFQLADVAIAFGGVHPPAPAAISAARYVIHDGATLCGLLEGIAEQA
jgi:HAD superfamily phosphoserine phosphatase-like hydrolase